MSKSPSNKHSYDFIKSEFEKRNYELISTEYINAHTKMKYRCLKHPETIQEVKYNQLSLDRACRFCGKEKYANKRKKDVDLVRKEFIDKDFIPLFANEDYKNDNSMLAYICNKHAHEVQYTKYHTLKKLHGCKYCYNERRGKTLRLDYDFVKNIFFENGYKLLDTEYINNTTKMRAVCHIHSEEVFEITYADIRSGSGCPRCGQEKRTKSLRKNVEYVREVFLSKNYTPLFNDDDYTGNDKKLAFVCNKHPSEIQYSTYSTLIRSTHNCQECYIESVSGENSRLYNPNLTNEDRELLHLLRKDKDASDWRKQIYERDNYTCQICGDSSGGNLNAHHLNGWSYFPEQRYDINNGICLCKECHVYGFHKTYGYNHNTIHQFMNYLYNNEYTVPTWLNTIYKEKYRSLIA